MADREAAGTAAAVPASRSTELTGWGRIEPLTAQLAEPDDAAQVAGLLAAAPARGVIARGLGRSYNNAAQCAGGLVIGTTAMRRITSFDTSTGLVTCDAGVSLEQLMVAALPAGWLVPVCPGNGAGVRRRDGRRQRARQEPPRRGRHRPGALAHADRPGWLASCLLRRDEPLFRATIGGMGLTGVILAAAFQLTPVRPREGAGGHRPYR